ncbi:putative short-chain dehydrogenase [Thozetella sp. PMI_491]|nr:putative short-chain dehydrogenase [Thozetella sp. PMI_491]
MNAGDFFRSQLCVKLPEPTKRYDGQTVIVTGSNAGLGVEAALCFVRLGAAKVILAVRNITKGEAAARSIQTSTKRTGVTEVWHLDLVSYASVKSFAARAQALERLDVLVNNAGILVYDFELAEDNESSITVNAVSPVLLSLMLLPKLRDTSIRFQKETVITFTGSFVHFMTEFPERKSINILSGLAVEETAQMKGRYYVSKLVQLLMIRELASLTARSTKPGDITINIVNPGFVRTEVLRHASATFHFFFKPYAKVVGRSQEEGARTILNGAEGGKGTHGEYLSDCKVALTSDFVRSPEGNEVQKKIWSELEQILERVEPNLLSNI